MIQYYVVYRYPRWPSRSDSMADGPFDTYREAMNCQLVRFPPAGPSGPAVVIARTCGPRPQPPENPGNRRERKPRKPRKPRAPREPRKPRERDRKWPGNH